MTISCFCLQNVTIEVISVTGYCSAGFTEGERFSINSVIPEGFCPVLYHSALPYMAASGNGARFNIPQKNFIIAQCPHPKIGIALKVCQNRNNITLEIDSKKSDCPYYNFKIGQKWEIVTEEPCFCRRAYDTLFPYVNAVSSNMRTGNHLENVFTATCPRYPDFVTFQIMEPEQL